MTLCAGAGDHFLVVLFGDSTARPLNGGRH